MWKTIRNNAEQMKKMNMWVTYQLPNKCLNIKILSPKKMLLVNT